eukprot:SAG31_NODE_2957_length_4857_cov_47.100883_5_plen_50_part_00
MPALRSVLLWHTVTLLYVALAGALVAKAFLQGDKYINLEIDFAGDAVFK